MTCMTRREFSKTALLGGLAASCCQLTAAEKDQRTSPNIVYILADDLGYGDLSCLNKASKLTTPNLDKLAAQGMIFSDAHSGSAVCTPTRYGVLTGRYSWRTWKKCGVLGGFSEPLIDTRRMTVASMLKANGYNTAMIGKWHLGMTFTTKDGKKQERRGKNVNWSAPIKTSPCSYGFDYYYGISASLDMPPYIYIENKKFCGTCTTQKAFHRPGPAHQEFEAIKVMPDLTRKAISFLDQQKGARKPFFLYFPLTAPHSPILPDKNFKGKSGLSSYGDFVLQVDWTVGQIMKTLKKNGQSDNTLFVFTSAQ